MSALMQSASSCFGPRLDLLGEAMIVRWIKSSVFLALIPDAQRSCWRSIRILSIEFLSLISDAQRLCWKVDADFRQRIPNSRAGYPTVVLEGRCGFPSTNSQFSCWMPNGRVGSSAMVDAQLSCWMPSYRAGSWKLSNFQFHSEFGAKFSIRIPLELAKGFPSRIPSVLAKFTEFGVKKQ